MSPSVNDWCVIPYELPVGSVSELVGMLVGDNFGEQSLMLPAGHGLDDQWQRWSMFTLSRSPSVGQADTRFFLPPAVGKLLEGEAMEKVHFLRDEMANMAWGVERTVPAAMGISPLGLEESTQLFPSAVCHTQFAVFHPLYAPSDVLHRRMDRE